MVFVDNIRSLTDFRHNAKQYVEQVQTTKSPLLLTVNGEASVVVEDAREFEALQRRLQTLEEEIQRLKFQALKEAVDIGAEQAERGQFSQRSFDEIIAAAKAAMSETDGV